MAGEKILARYILGYFGREPTMMVGAITELENVFGATAKSTQSGSTVYFAVTEASNYWYSPKFAFDGVDGYVQFCYERPGHIHMKPHGGVEELFRKHNITTEGMDWDRAKELLPHGKPAPVEPVIYAPPPEPLIPRVIPGPTPRPNRRPRGPVMRRVRTRKQQPVRRVVDVTRPMEYMVLIIATALFFSSGLWFLTTAGIASLIIMVLPASGKREPRVAMVMLMGGAITAVGSVAHPEGALAMLAATTAMSIYRGHVREKIITLLVWILVAMFASGEQVVHATGIVAGLMLIATLIWRR